MTPTVHRPPALNPSGPSDAAPPATSGLALSLEERVARGRRALALVERWWAEPDSDDETAWPEIEAGLRAARRGFRAESSDA